MGARIPFEPQATDYGQLTTDRLSKIAASAKPRAWHGICSNRVVAEEILRSVLAAEARARAIVAEAERAAHQRDVQARAEAAGVRRRQAAEAAGEAQAVRASAHREAEEERARILAAADEDARRLQVAAEPRLEAATRVVVQRVLDP